MNSARLGFAAGVLAVTSLIAQAAYHSKPGLWLGPSQLPLTLGDWQGREGGPLDAETMAVLKADGVINRVYARDTGRSPVDLYVAYYARQQPGVSIHSPLHCLPGTGWEVQSAGSVDLVSSSGVAGEARKLIAQKNRDRALVLYWYSVHGRMVGSEAASRLYLLGDRLRLGRNDAALVRVVAPMDDGEEAAVGQAVGFIRDLLPQLPRLWS
ncbi:MAG TPA: EpsI family protein [Vicinamibacterales bacterium]|jgi:EpsI family protein